MAARRRSTLASVRGVERSFLPHFVIAGLQNLRRSELNQLMRLLFQVHTVQIGGTEKRASRKRLNLSFLPNAAAQHRIPADIPGWAILPDGSGYMSFPVYRVGSLQGCG